MKIERFQNWPILLSAYLQSARDRPFAWGENDCVMFAARCVEVLTGRDFYGQYAGYTSEDGAREIIAAAGGIESLVARHLGPGHRNNMKARRGDIVMMKLPGKTLGVVDDSGASIACVSPAGMVRLPLRRAWRIWGY